MWYSLRRNDAMMQSTHIQTGSVTEKKKRVLVVDDIRTDLHFVGKLVIGFDHEVILAESGLSALEVADGSIDLIIVDAVMPDMDGFELVRSVRANQQLSHIPVIMVTSLSGKKDRIKAVEVGINDFISKPVDRIELKVRMDSMLRMKEAQDRVREYQKELEHLVEQKTFALNSTLQKLQAVLDGMNDCMVTVDRDLRITEMNQAFLRISGKSKDALKGLPFNDLLVGHTQTEGFASLFEHADTSAELDMEFPQWGRNTFSVLTTPMENQGHLIMMRDITEKKQADEKRARFLCILSHELITPLNGIKGLSDLMLMDSVALPEDSRRYVGMINTCGNKLEKIVKELLRFVEFYSDMSSPEDNNVRLDLLTENVIKSLSEKKDKKHISILFSEENPPSVVYGKSDHFVEILLQIIDNALKFSKEHGTVEVVLKNSPGEVQFICRDQGDGIEEKDLEHVFDSFYQAENYITRAQDGLGLGLTIAKKVVELYKGIIDIKSAPGKGTEVIVAIPKPA